GSYNYVVFDDKVVSIVERIRLMATPGGEVYGFATKDGKIYLDPEKMNANTPIHEYGHLWTDFAKKNHPELYRRMVAAARRSDLMDELKDNPKYAELTAEERAEEILARAIADKGEGMFKDESQQGAFQRLLQDLWEWVKNTLGVGDGAGLRGLSPEDVSRLTFGELSEGAARELLSGRRVGEVAEEGGKYIRDMENKADGHKWGAEPIDAITAKVEEAKGNVSEEQIQRYQKGATLEEAIGRLHGLIDETGTVSKNGHKELFVTNTETGERAALTKASVGKLVSGKAIGQSRANGFTKEQHLAAVMDIEDLFRNSTKVGSHPDKDDTKSVTAINRFIAPIRKDEAAYITERVTTSGERIYSLELIRMGAVGDKIRDINKLSNPVQSPTDTQIFTPETGNLPEDVNNNTNNISDSAPKSKEKNKNNFADVSEPFAHTSDDGAGSSGLPKIEQPELVEIAKSLLGGIAPKIKRALKRGANGLEYRDKDGNAHILLKADLFKDPEQAVKTLAHELGHADHVDGEKGHIGEAIQNLKDGMASIMEKPTPGESLDVVTIHDELYEFSKKWRPFDESTATRREIAYRKKPEEVYADAVSALLTDPDALARGAPTAFKAIMDGLKNKPEFYRPYQEIVSRYAEGGNAAVAHRHESLSAGMDAAQARKNAAEKAKQAEEDAKNKDKTLRDYIK
ncbi:MAG: hypothetical protein LBB74_02885, partial [Chitinispirillales bacterium]|nr:hypothetical protein [Chitinispirillales bacterium]